MNFDQLHQLWDHQRKLMERFRPIETGNLPGLNWEDLPVRFQTYRGDALLKYLSWCVVEEIAEARLCTTDAELEEELIDAVHFMVELMITAGVGSSQIYAFRYRLTPPLGHEDSFIRFIQQLALANHCLKQRPWKCNPISTDVDEYQLRLCFAFWFLIDYLTMKGLTPERILNAYVAKNAINHQRIDSGT